MENPQPMTTPANGRSLRGFASMDKEKQRTIASKGGRAAHEKGTAHEFSPQEASMAAKKGHERGTAHEFTPEEARLAGRKGGLARAKNRARNAPETMASDDAGRMAPEAEMPMQASEPASDTAR